MATSKTVVLIMCAGTGNRAGLGYNKLLFKIDGQTILEYTLSRFDLLGVDRFLVASNSDLEVFNKIASKYEDVFVLEGGSTRSESVFKALNAIKDFGYETVLIHDGARPLVSVRDIEKCIALTQNTGSAIAFSPQTDTVLIKKDGELAPLERERLLSIKTPQGFNFNKILSAYEMGIPEGATDDSAVYKAHFGECNYFECDSTNIKFTHRTDLVFLKNALLGNKKPSFKEQRTGTGFDVHRFSPNRRLVLGGVKIPYELGLLGHSDADVVVHALMDAMLSACALGDIGQQFPDTDQEYKDIDSLKLLKKVNTLVLEKGFIIQNLSIVIHAEAPKLAPFIFSMRKNIASCLKTSIDQVGISATTWEKLGFVGEKQGIASHANILLIEV